MTASNEVTRDIIVVGASSGGVEALSIFAAGLAPSLPAAVFVVLHIGSNPSMLPEILSRAGPLPAVHPVPGELIVNGKIYVAPPDHHLMIEPNHILLWHGPKENRARPAVNPLFRSAAVAYGSRVAGVVLTGALDDGTAGLAEIRRRGGIAVVQDPRTAACPGMPESALQYVDVDYTLPLAEIPLLLSELAITARQPEKARSIMPQEAVQKSFSGITCPECRGPIFEERQGKIVEYRCRVGHTYSPLSLVEEHEDTVERSLWSALVALEEAADVAEQLAHVTPNGPYVETAQKRREQIKLIKSILAG